MAIDLFRVSNRTQDVLKKAEEGVCSGSVQNDTLSEFQRILIDRLCTFECETGYERRIGNASGCAALIKTRKSRYSGKGSLSAERAGRWNIGSPRDWAMFL